MEQAETFHPPQPKRSNKTLWIMVIVFLSPILLAWITYTAKDKLTFTQKQHGEFVVPIVPLSLQELRTAEGDYFSAKESEASWLLVSLYSDSCDKQCQFQLDTMDDLRKTLLKDKDKLYIGGLDLNSLPAQLTDAQHSQIDKLWLIDPEQRLMMSYGPDIPWKGVLADIKHLIKYSKS